MKIPVPIFLFLYLFFAAGLLFSVEVSEQQDLAIFGLTYYAYDIPDDVLGFADSSINNVFVNLKRFNVLGYGNYRMEKGDIDNFIKRIREIQSEKAKEAGTYDEKFGTVVIKGEDFDKIVNSFLVVIPSLSNYSVGTERTEYQSGLTKYVVNSYVVYIVIDLSFVNVREGKQEAALRISGSGTDENIDNANRKAVENAVSGLAYNIKQLETFKIKSGVIRVRGDTVYFEIGGNLGVKPGDEYEVMTKQEVGSTGRIVALPTGLIRVKKVYPDITEARIVLAKEKITEGDQLLEVARFGVQVAFSAGVMKVDIPNMNYNIILGDDADIPPFTNQYFIELNQKEVNNALVAGLRITKDLGYRYMGVFDATALLNFPLIGGIGEIGVGTTFQKRRISLELLAQGGIFYMTTFSEDLDRNGLFPFITIDGTRIDFDQDPTLNIFGIAVGVKGGVGLSYRLKPNASLRAGVGYRLYTPIKNWKLKIVETSGGTKESVTIGSDNDNIDELEGGLKKVSITGYEIKLSFDLKF